MLVEKNLMFDQKIKIKIKMNLLSLRHSKSDDMQSCSTTQTGVPSPPSPPPPNTPLSDQKQEKNLSKLTQKKRQKTLLKRRCLCVTMCMHASAFLCKCNLPFPTPKGHSGGDPSQLALLYSYQKDVHICHNTITYWQLLVI